MAVGRVNARDVRQQEVKITVRAGRIAQGRVAVNGFVFPGCSQRR
jgi:hypothetical protein